MENEVVNYLKSIVQGKTCKEIAELINKKYNTVYTENDIYNAKRRYKLKSNIDCKFKKGMTSHNKGKKWDDYMSKEGQKNSKKTCFKKGHKPHNWVPVGTEILSTNGYIYIKVNEPNDWQLKHRYIYQKNYGEIPEGYSVIFLDQNKQNFNIDNLQLVKIKDKLVAKNNHLFSSDKEVTKTGICVAQLIDKTYEVKKQYVKLHKI